MKYRPLLPLVLVIVLGHTLWGCGGLQSGRRVEEPLEVRLERILLERALEYERQGQPQKALQAYEAALAVVMDKKKNLERSLRSEAGKHYDRGLEFRRQGKYAEARREFLVALRFWPDFPEVVDLLKLATMTSKTPYLVHEVKEGEFLTAIAENYYQDQSKFTVIAHYNNLKDPEKLYAGMKLKIPEIEGTDFQQPIETESTQESSRMEDIGKAPNEVEDKPSKQKVPPISESEATRSGQEGIAPVVALDYDELSALETDYDQVGIYEEQAVSLLEEGQYLAALHEFQKVYNTDPTRKGIREHMSRAHYRQGEVYFKNAQYLEARRHFREALIFYEQCTSCEEYLKRSEDAYKDTHYLKGIQHFEEERLREAIEEWELVSEVDSNYKQVQNYLSRARILLEKVQELKEKP